MSASVTVSQAPAVAPRMLTWTNGQWSWMPHKQFFENNLKAHLEKVDAAQRKLEELRIRAHVQKGDVVKVNNLMFRFRYHSQQKEVA